MRLKTLSALGLLAGHAFSHPKTERPRYFVPKSLKDGGIAPRHSMNADAQFQFARDPPYPLRPRERWPRDDVHTLTIANNQSTAMKVYIQGRNSNDIIVFVSPTKTTFYEPPAPSATTKDHQLAIPGDQIEFSVSGNDHKDIQIPSDLSSARVYFAEQSLEFATNYQWNGTAGLVVPAAANVNDASYNISWGFAEFTWTGKDGLTINPSYVDGVSPIQVYLEAVGQDNTKYNTTGLPDDGLEKICDKLEEQAKDGYLWGDLCIRAGGKNSTILRVVSPNIRRSQTQDQNAFDGYFEKYVDQVWDFYSSKNLTVDTQALKKGNISCSVQSGQLNCNNNAGSFSKPSTADVFSCSSGPFENSGTD